MRAASLAGLGIIAIALAACATPQHNYVPERSAFSRPPIGETVTARVGDVLLAQGEVTRTQGIDVPAGTQIGGYTLQGGFYPQTGQDETHTYHGFAFGSSAPGGLIAGAFMDPPVSIQAGRETGQLCVVTAFNIRACRERAFERTERVLERDNSFQQTLIYNGRVGDRINIGYREFAGNMARPAFSNAVEYDLSASTLIGYQGAQLEIVEATNTSITYRVLRNFNTATP